MPPDRPGTPFNLALGHWGPATDPGHSRGPGGASLVCKLSALCTCSGGGLALPLRALLRVAQGHADRCGSAGGGGGAHAGPAPHLPQPGRCSRSFSSNRNLSCPAQPSACQSCWGRGGRARWPVPGLTALRFPAEGVIPRHSSVHTGSLLREKRREHNRPTVEATRLLGCAGGRTRWSRAVGGARAVTRHPGEKRLKPATSLLCPTPPQEDYRCFLL